MYPAENDFAESPTLAQIVSKVLPMGGVDRDEFVRTQYLGKRVHWYGRFFDIQSLGPIAGTYQLSFGQRGFKLNNRGLIFAHVRLGAFPQLERLQRGIRVDLWGTITEVDGLLGVTLDLDRAEVLPESLFDRMIVAPKPRA